MKTKLIIAVLALLMTSGAAPVHVAGSPSQRVTNSWARAIGDIRTLEDDHVGCSTQDDMALVNAILRNTLGISMDLPPGCTIFSWAACCRRQSRIRYGDLWANMCPDSPARRSTPLLGGCANRIGSGEAPPVGKSWPASLRAAQIRNSTTMFHCVVTIARSHPPTCRDRAQGASPMPNRHDRRAARPRLRPACLLDRRPGDASGLISRE